MYIKNNRLLQQVLILAQYFLIILAYHFLKDLKDTVVITSSDAGAKVIPFIKLWVILPAAFIISYLFSVLLRRVRKEYILPMMMFSLLGIYGLFAFWLYPNQQHMHCHFLADQLEILLPAGCQGFIEMVRFWIFTLFYLSAELWSITIVSVLFWGYLNDYTTMKEARRFYPMCVLAGNCAAIVSGQMSKYLVQTIGAARSWGATLQSLILVVIACGILIVVINHLLYRFKQQRASLPPAMVNSDKESFLSSIRYIFRSPTLLCIATLVIGFSLTSNLFEVVWKDSIKTVYSSPQQYNAYMNQLTSLIGILAVSLSLISKWFFQRFSWKVFALITPVALLITNSMFYGYKLAASNAHAAMILMTLGSVCYITALASKYTVFDISKEMAFLQINHAERMKGKSIIDSVGSRLGKSGASVINSILIIGLASSGYFVIVGVISISVFSAMILSVTKNKSMTQTGDRVT